MTCMVQERSDDRIVVLSEGRKVGQLSAREISEDSIMHMLAHGSESAQEADHAE